MVLGGCSSFHVLRCSHMTLEHAAVYTQNTPRHKHDPETWSIHFTHTLWGILYACVPGTCSGYKITTNTDSSGNASQALVAAVNSCFVVFEFFEVVVDVVGGRLWVVVGYCPIRGHCSKTWNDVPFLCRGFLKSIFHLTLILLNSLCSGLEACVKDLSDWMSSNKLKLNSDKTELLLIELYPKP